MKRLSHRGANLMLVRLIQREQLQQPIAAVICIILLNHSLLKGIVHQLFDCQLYLFYLCSFK
ncbi:hypothetical protein D3C85_1830570 [compost metagenome]